MRNKSIYEARHRGLSASAFSGEKDAFSVMHRQVDVLQILGSLSGFLLSVRVIRKRYMLKRNHRLHQPFPDKTQNKDEYCKNYGNEVPPPEPYRKKAGTGLWIFYPACYCGTREFFRCIGSRHQ